MDVNKFRGAWGYDVDSVEFVRELRKSSRIHIQEVSATAHKFYKTQYLIEVLSEEPIRGDVNLKDIEYMITEGDCSGDVRTFGSVEISGAEAAKLLKRQGSDPSFFRIDENGNDIEVDTYEV